MLAASNVLALNCLLPVQYKWKLRLEELSKPQMRRGAATDQDGRPLNKEVRWAAGCQHHLIRAVLLHC